MHRRHDDETLDHRTPRAARRSATCGPFACHPPPMPIASLRGGRSTFCPRFARRASLRSSLAEYSQAGEPPRTPHKDSELASLARLGAGSAGRSGSAGVPAPPRPRLRFAPPLASSSLRSSGRVAPPSPLLGVAPGVPSAPALAGGGGGRRLFIPPSPPSWQQSCRQAQTQTQKTSEAAAASFDLDLSIGRIKLFVRTHSRLSSFFLESR